MKKIAFLTIIIVTALLSFLMQADWGAQKFTDALEANPDNITKMELSMPGENSYRTTTGPGKIQTFMKYFNSKDYIRIRGNEPTELPTSASMIYLHGNEHTDFLVVFGDKVLISYDYYEVRDDRFDMTFLKKFSQSIE
ncbi:hypothetical protein [Lentibacillus salicampi]|uniref:DUF4367 domain-containing protein n=1 Tax=Lentibacillus salicampi TaxID=175306 RepID=A0A4Y9AGW9_9BACI|nr:hypothetical protein [Lentibacillus salicampi]TFJ94210.1 hypothetical protein E4U82_02845 [Lentibacillus salicampi]